MGNELRTHPTVIRFLERGETYAVPPMLGDALDPAWLRQVCLDAGADDREAIRIGNRDIDSTGIAL